MEEYGLDVIPEFLYYRDIADHGVSDGDLKRRVFESPHVTRITEGQWDDGSWGCFHSLEQGSGTVMTTESALRRLLILGLDKDDGPMRRAVSYMTGFLNKEIELRDREGCFSDWDRITDLFAAAWMLMIDPANGPAGEIADKWAALISQCVDSGGFRRKEYFRVFPEIFGVKADRKRVWDIECFHVAAILVNRLDAVTEDSFVDYLLSSGKGMYYITNRCRLIDLPGDFMSGETVRFLHAHILLSRYPSYSGKTGFLIDWLMDNRGKDGLWDLGPRGRINPFLPYSESWRKSINRRIDSTILVRTYLNRLGYSLS